jgi:hypothetical protein
MATTTKRLARGAFTTTVTTALYTVPSATTTIVTNMAICNTAGTSATFTLALAGTRIHEATTIAANSTVYVDLKQVLNATETIQGGASATTVNFHISGVEVA